MPIIEFSYLSNVIPIEAVPSISVNVLNKDFFRSFSFEDSICLEIKPNKSSVSIFWFLSKSLCFVHKFSMLQIMPLCMP